MKVEYPLRGSKKIYKADPEPLVKTIQGKLHCMLHARLHVANDSASFRCIHSSDTFQEIIEELKGYYKILWQEVPSISKNF